VSFDAVNRAAVVTSTALLAAGLGLWLVRGPVESQGLLDAGLIALMMTPVLRLVTTLADDVRRRDAGAVAATLAVATILGVGLALALGR
jgi:uncharacterized membrane protein